MHAIDKYEKKEIMTTKKSVNPDEVIGKNGDKKITTAEHNTSLPS